MYLLEGMLVGGDDISHKHNAANGVQANMNPEKKIMNQQRKQNSVLSGSLLVTNYRVTISKNAKFHNKSKVFGEFCFDFCQR